MHDIFYGKENIHLPFQIRESRLHILPVPNCLYQIESGPGIFQKTFLLLLVACPILDILVNFWDSVLFQNDVYRKNAMQPHLILHQQSPLQKHHFETWLTYFNESVDELFEGEKAFLAKERALSIATVMQIKISQLN